MTTPEHTKSNEAKPHQNESFWPYGIGACLLLLVLTAAILTPDYLNHLDRQAALKRLPPLSWQLSTNPLAQVTLVGTNQTPPNALLEPTLKTADVYETYGKLITMLLGFVSIIGVLFGYVVRKNVRELADDMHNDMARELDHFRRDRDLALKEVDTANKSAQKALEDAAALEKRFLQLDAVAKQRLDDLDEAIGNYQKRRAKVPSSKETTAAVDDELKKEGL